MKISVLKAVATFFFRGFYGYADEPDVKRMLWSLGEKLEASLVPSRQRVADPVAFRRPLFWGFCNSYPKFSDMRHYGAFINCRDTGSICEAFHSNLVTVS